MLSSAPQLVSDEALASAFKEGQLALSDKISQLAAHGKNRAAQEAMYVSAMQELGSLQEYNKLWIESNIPKAYKHGWDDAFNSSLYATPTQVGGAYGSQAFAKLHKEAIEHLAYSMKYKTDAAFNQVGRQINDIWREVSLQETLRRQFTGETIKESAARLKAQFEDQGLMSFTDKAGRSWKLDSYCTMVARTTTREATTQGTLLRAQRLGYEYIELSEHYPTCGLCEPLQGRVYTMNENDKRYPLWQDDYCPVHPNCLHTIHVYIRKYDKNADATMKKSNRPFNDARSAKEKQAYNALQRENRRLNDLRNQYSRYVARLGPDKVPTIQGFSRMRNANSQAWKDLQSAYRGGSQAKKSAVSKPPFKSMETFDPATYTRLTKQNADAYFGQLDLTPLEREALNAYTSSSVAGNYTHINHYLRTNSFFGPEDVIIRNSDLMKQALAKSKNRLHKDTIFYRKTAVPEITQKLEAGKGIESLKGTTFNDKGFSSTSTADIAVGGGHPHHMEIYAPKGTRGAYIRNLSMYDNEYEYLLDTDTTFEIVEAYTAMTEYGPKLKLIVRIIKQGVM